MDLDFDLTDSSAMLSDVLKNINKKQHKYCEMNKVKHFQNITVI